MTKAQRLSLRCTPQTVEKANELAKLWGPVKALSLADVVAECIERVYKQESKRKEKRD